MTKILTTSDLDGVAEYIKTRNPKRIVLCVGAGISTNSGIPDFRTPGTGLYSNLAALNLPYPEAVFSLQYFRQDPEPFYTLAQGLYPGTYKPSLTHTFLRLLQDKEVLLRCFTQNIDTLERMAGVTEDNIVEAHGSFATARCIDCRFSDEDMKKAIDDKVIPKCPKCEGLVKPDIVFFGEALPTRFFTRREDMHAADLVFVIGTSLVVHPFAQLPEYVPPSVPRVLFNNDPVENFDRPNDVCVLGDCDESVWSLCQKLGWHTDLWKLHNEIGGVARDWEVGDGKEKGENKAEDTVEQLAKQLDEELKLDKEEDVELKKEEERGATDDKVAKSDTWDDDAVVLKKDIQAESEPTIESSSKGDLAEELKMDQEEDVDARLQKAEEQVDKPDDPTSWDEDDVPNTSSPKDPKQKL